MSNIRDGSILAERNQKNQDQQQSWPDKHRPQTVREVTLAQELEGLAQSWIADGVLRHHLLLHGDPAVGKTTLANAMAKDLFPEHQTEHVLRINATQARSIDTVRGLLLPWLQVRGGLLRAFGDVWRSLVIFSEADGLTRQAQDALKDALEDYADTTRFIFTTNHVEAVDEAIRSRCTVVEMKPPALPDRARILQRVLGLEGYERPEEEVLAFCQHYLDVRELLRTAQDQLSVDGHLSGPPPEPPSVDEAELWPEPVDGAVLLTAIRTTFERYLVLPDGASFVVALWSLFAHAHDAFQVSPLLAITSPVKQSGKSRLLQLLSRIVPRPLLASNNQRGGRIPCGGGNAADAAGR